MAYSDSGRTSNTRNSEGLHARFGVQPFTLFYSGSDGVGLWTSEFVPNLFCSFGGVLI